MKSLVTGGGGFLGGKIVELLLARGDEVRIFARGAYPALEAQGVEVCRGDLADAAAVKAACAGVDTVFHVAAKAGAWGPYAAFYAANVTGTQHVLDACRALDIPRLVHTSSPSVVFNGEDLEGVTEAVPYPPHHEAAYPATKQEAEQRVLAANSATLATVALRPHAIWGPGDTNITPRLVERARAGRLRRIGLEPKRVDATYIDNAAAAHLNAADRLAPDAACAGRAYFIANDEPMPLWELIDGILAAHDLPPAGAAVPLGVVLAASGVLEALHTLFRRPGEPLMTRWAAQELGTAHWFDLSAARRDLGYQPTVSTAEGLRRLHAHVHQEGEPVSEQPELVKPLLRGYSHALAAIACLPASYALLQHAAPGRATVASAIFMACIFLLFFISAVYHLVKWGPLGMGVMRRIDHGMIFCSIAGFYTPFCMLGLPGPHGQWLLAAIWTGAVLGVMRVLLWPYAPRWAATGSYVIISSMAAPWLGELESHLTAAAILDITLGFLFAGFGGLCYALSRPEPWPGVLGHHEVFHMAVIGCATCYYLAVWTLVPAF